MSAFMKMVKISTGLGSLGVIAYYTMDRLSPPVALAASPSSSPHFKPRSLVKWDDNWDFRQVFSDQASEQNRRLPVRNLILIRHGQYNLKGLTDKEKTLTELGRKQAALTGKRLKELGLPYTRLIHSTMTRATETADIIHHNIPNVPVEKCSLLEEGLPFEPEPPFHPSSLDPNDRINVLKKLNMHLFEDGARIEAAFRKYFYRANPKQEGDSYDIIVCHANVIRYFVCRALQLPPEAWLRMSLKHASITWISVYDGGRVSLLSYGDAGYMPPESLTTT